MPTHFPVRRVTPQVTLQLGFSTEISPKKSHLSFSTLWFFSENMRMPADSFTQEKISLKNLKCVEVTAS